MKKEVHYLHGVTSLGNLQTYRVERVVRDGVEIAYNRSTPYTPKDINKMEGFDEKSKEVALAISTPKAMEIKEKTNGITGNGLVELVTYDRMIGKNNVIAIRRITRIFDNGKQISKKYHRDWIRPGMDIVDFDEMSMVLAKHFHTTECIEIYAAAMEKRELMAKADNLKKR